MSDPEKFVNKFGVRNKFSVFSKPVVEPGKPSRTQQHFKDDCDINKILAKYKKTGVLDHVRRAREIYGDFSQYTSAAENMDKVAKANSMFESLPAELRTKHFNNSIQGFLSYIGDPQNVEQCYQWGIYDRPAPAPNADPVPSPAKKEPGE